MRGFVCSSTLTRRRRPRSKSGHCRRRQSSIASFCKLCCIPQRSTLFGARRSDLTNLQKGWDTRNLNPIGFPFPGQNRYRTAISIEAQFNTLPAWASIRNPTPLQVFQEPSRAFPVRDGTPCSSELHQSSALGRSRSRGGQCCRTIQPRLRYRDSGGVPANRAESVKWLRRASARSNLTCSSPVWLKMSGVCPRRTS